MQNVYNIILSKSPKLISRFMLEFGLKMEAYPTKLRFRVHVFEFDFDPILVIVSCNWFVITITHKIISKSHIICHQFTSVCPKFLEIIADALCDFPGIKARFWRRFCSGFHKLMVQIYPNTFKMNPGKHFDEFEQTNGKFAWDLAVGHEYLFFFIFGSGQAW